MTLLPTVIDIVIVSDVDVIKHVSIACSIQGCLIVLTVSSNHSGYASFYYVGYKYLHVGGVNYDIIVSLLMKYYF